MKTAQKPHAAPRMQPRAAAESAAPVEARQTGQPAPDAANAEDADSAEFVDVREMVERFKTVASKYQRSRQLAREGHGLRLFERMSCGHALKVASLCVSLPSAGVAQCRVRASVVHYRGFPLASHSLENPTCPNGAQTKQAPTPSPLRY